MSDFFRSIDAAAVFGAEKPGKADLFAGRQLFVGLNCFEPGQAQRVHAHAGADKFYVVVSAIRRVQDSFDRSQQLRNGKGLQEHGGQLQPRLPAQLLRRDRS